jgi:hypothetical protein
VVSLADSNPSKRPVSERAAIPLSGGGSRTEGRPNTSDQARTAARSLTGLTDGNPSKRRRHIRIWHARNARPGNRISISLRVRLFGAVRYFEAFW